MKLVVPEKMKRRVKTPHLAGVAASRLGLFVLSLVACLCLWFVGGAEAMAAQTHCVMSTTHAVDGPAQPVGYVVDTGRPQPPAAPNVFDCLGCVPQRYVALVSLVVPRITLSPNMNSNRNWFAFEEPRVLQVLGGS